MVKNDEIYKNMEKKKRSHISMFLRVSVLNAHLFHIFVFTLIVFIEFKGIKWITGTLLN